MTAPFIARVVLFFFSLDTVVLAHVRPLLSSSVGVVAAPGAGSTALAASATECDEALLSGQAPLAFVTRAELWPPNHALLDVGLGIDLTVACVNRAALHVSVWSDEPDENQTGDGNHPVDAQLDGADLYLRAERRGDSDGRVYLIVATATGPGGATGTDCATVTVPHGRSRSSLASVQAQAQAAREYCAAYDAAPAGFHLLAEGDPVRANQAPRVDAGPDQGIDLGASAVLDGTVTDDGLPSGSLAVSWSKLSGPGPVAFSQPQSEDTLATFGSAGTYVLRLTATDTVLSASDDVRIVVEAANQAPIVDAGPDQSVTLADLVSLPGVVTDDGLPHGTLSIEWSRLSGPADVSFADPTSPTTLASFTAEGVYVLRLSAHDGQLDASDDVQVTVSPEPLPELSVADAEVTEGADGTQGALFQLSLSKPWGSEVSVDYMTFDGTATATCDYLTRYGSVSIPVGETQAAVLVPVIGELQPESAETVALRLGNVSGATLARSEAALTITDDDAANEPPAFEPVRSPFDGASGVAQPPSLVWSATDPDADAVSYDVQLGSVFARTGQAWNATCTASAGPTPRAAPAAALDEAADRLIVFGGVDDDPNDVWILRNATGAGGPPEWTAMAVQGGPGALKGASAAFDAASDRLIVHGGCTGGCGSAAGETWVLTHANGLGGAPQWMRLELADAPVGRRDAAAAYDAASRRLVVFGGTTGDGGAILGDVWVLHDASGMGQPAWERLSPTGSAPSPRRGASAVWDPTRGAILVFGGLDAAGRALGDAWVIENVSAGSPSWRRLSPDGPRPTARWGHVSALDPASGRMLVLGGSTAGLEKGRNFVFNDTWLLSEPFGAAPEWTRLTPAGVLPPGRFQPAAAYSATENRLVVALGANNRRSAPLDDLWTLADAAGALPQVASQQPETTYVAAGLEPGPFYYWRVRARDEHGASRGSRAWRFTADAPPVVDAGPDQAVTLAAPTVPLLGAVSDDGLPAGAPLAIAWSLASGPATVTFADPAAPSTSATFSVEGSYVLRLTADDSILSAWDEVAIQVGPAPPINLAPVVNAGADRVIVLPTTSALLQGTASDDGRPSGALTLAWSQSSGPTPVAFDTPGAASTNVTFPVPGVYELRLVASDGELSSSDEVRVVVEDFADLEAQVLDVSNLRYDGQTLEASGTALLTIANVGVGPVLADFEVTAFEDRNGNGSFEPGPDAVLGTASTGSLAAGAVASLPISIAGEVLFRGNLVHAFVDSSGAVTEADEANNFADSRPACQPTPTALPFSPRLEWAWTGSAVAPASDNVIIMPLVVDLDRDGVPDIVFTTHTTNDASNGRLRAISGRGGQELFTVTDPALDLRTYAALAAGDIDRDGLPEIVAVHEDNNRLVAFEHDGSAKWVSGFVEWIGYGGPAIADLDADGRPEIVVGRQVLNADGTLRWTGTRGSAWNGEGSLPVVADVDMDGRPDVVAGNTAYRADGTILWFNPGVGDGFNAVANFDADPFPEIALVTSGFVWLLEHDGAVKWGPVAIPGGGWGGAPTVADVDGDGQPEIGVAGATRYVVLETAGSIKWAAVTRDQSSSATASTVFDFEGDGSAEVVYGDEQKLRIFRGSDGNVLWEQLLSTCTTYENPVVADVDADGNAEIVAVGNRTCGFGSDHGVFVFGDANDAWLATRRTWNQHSYHVTNVNDDATIPIREANSWQGFNNYRQNRLTTGCEYARPDLTASYVRKSASGPTVNLTIRIGNAGALVVAAGLPLALYDGAPEPGKTPVATAATTRYLNPGEYEDVTVMLAASTPARPLWVVADDQGGLQGTQLESDEENNAHDSRLFLLPEANLAPVVDAGPDRELTLPQDTLVLDAVVTDDGLPLGTLTLSWGLVSGPQPVAFGTPASEDTIVTFSTPGSYVLRLSADDGELVASDEVAVTVRAPQPDLAVTAVQTSALITDGQSLVVSGTLAAAITNAGAGPVAGSFTTTFFEDRDLSGRFESGQDTVLGSVLRGPLAAGAAASVSAPASGTLSFAGSPVLAFVDSGFQVEEGDEENNTGSSAPALPDLTASFVRDADVPEGVRLTARVGNGGRTSVPANVSVAFYDRDPRSGSALLVTAQTTQALAGGACEDVAVVLASGAEARPLFVVADDSGGLQGSVVEADEANNVHDSRIFLTTVTNEGPVVSGGPDLAVTLPAAAVLDATVTDDGQPLGTLTFSWTQVGGPGPVAFGTASSEDTTASFTTPGVHVLRLTASDGELTGSDDVVVDVSPANEPPVVNAGPEASVTSPSAVLSGTVTDDGRPSGTLTVAWSQLSGPSPATLAAPSALQTGVQFQAPGAYVFRLTASDSELSATDDVALSVAFVNQAPVVDAGPGATITLPQDQAALDGTVTDDGLPLGAPVTPAWSLVAGPGLVVFLPPDAVDTMARFSVPGSYTLRLTASDSSLSASDTLAVTVLPAPASGPPPSVEISSPQDGDRITAPVPVVATVSSGTLAAWTLEQRLAGEEAWTPFASGNTPASNGTLASFDPSQLLNGSYELRLSATDSAGRTTRTIVSAVVRDNLKVGNFSVSFVDLEVPVSGLPIRVTRSYDSRDKASGDFGFGWRLDLSTMRVGEGRTPGLDWQGTASQGAFPTYCLPETRPHVVTVTDPSGRVHEFETVVTPQCQPFVPIEVVRVGFRPRPGSLGTLAVAGNDEALVVGSFPGSVELYDSITYQVFDPAAYQYIAPDGRSFLIQEASGVERVDDLNGNRLTVGPNGITHSSGKGVTFTRDAAGRIQRISDPMGRSIEYAYDANGDLVSVTDRELATTRFTYAAAQPHLLEEIQDPLGRTPLRNEYDDGGRLIRHTDAFGKTIEYTHALGTRQEIVKDRNDRIRVLEYDERGNLVKETQPDGRIVRRTFDARNNRTSETEPHDASNPSPFMTIYAYDPQDNVTGVTDPLGNTTEYTYNARQQVVTAKDARGRFTVNSYDTNGNLTATKSGGASVDGPFLSESTHTYDARGNLRTLTTVVDGVPHVTSYDYDAFGNLTREADALGHVTTHTYDGNGNRLTQTTTRRLPGGGNETLATQYEYDEKGRLARTIDPDGTATRTVYDPFGRQIETWDKLNRRTAFEYDEMGRMVRTTYPDQTVEESTYDPEGRRLTSRDRVGRTTAYEYDELGRLRRTTYPDQTFTENTYDAAGRLVATKDGRGRTTSYEYDAAGRRTTVRDPLGNETVFSYDANGNQRTVRDARLNTTTLEYDDLNRRTKTVFPDSTFTETAYDSLGRRVSEKDQAGRVTRFQYDRLSRLTKVVDALNQETVYAYDELGNRTLQRDANGHETRFEYDRLGRETARILPDGARETKAYDPAGNLETRTNFMGRVTTYAYDDNNRLTTRSYPNPAENVSFTYTPTGRRATATDSRGTTTYGYDVRDRLISLAKPGVGSLSYAYDGNGNRTTLTATLGGQGYITTYSYDDASRLDVVTDPADRGYDFDHDANGSRSSLQYPNGTATVYTYDALNRLTNLTTTGPLGTVQGYAFTLGQAGNRTRIDESDGTVREYGYDALYRLTSETVRDTLTTLYTKTFSYDPVGNRQTQTTTGGGAPGLPDAGTVDYSYDTRDRLLTENASTLTYDANGNLTAKVGEATYTWDHESRLIRVTKADGAVTETAYDADGNRLQTRVTPPTGPPTTTNYLVDTSGGLSHVVAETDAANALQALYVRGSDDLLSVMRPEAAGGWSSRFFHADGIGSIRRLTNEAGTITDGYAYAAFGELLSHTGSDRQPYAFAGEPYDPNVGFQYHRARWMDPKVGRFVGIDPFSGSEFDPGSLHKYSYAAGEPISHVDPTGRFTLPDISLTLLIRSVIQTIAISAPLRALYAARELKAGNDLGVVAQEFAIGIATDVAVSIALLGVLQYAPRLLQLRAVGQVVQRAANSPWNADPFTRGRLIEQLILGGPGRGVPGPNAAVIDDLTNGVATSIKSVDLTAATYESASALRGVLSRYARDLASYSFNLGASGPVNQRALVIAIEEGAATARQAEVITEFLRNSRYIWPELRIALVTIP